MLTSYSFNLFCNISFIAILNWTMYYIFVYRCIIFVLSIPDLIRRGQVLIFTRQ